MKLCKDCNHYRAAYVARPSMCLFPSNTVQHWETGEYQAILRLDTFRQDRCGIAEARLWEEKKGD